MSEAHALLVRLAAQLQEFNADLAKSGAKYVVGADTLQDDVIAEQLFAVLTLVDRWVKPPATLLPLWDHLHQLVERRSSRHGRGNNAVGLVDTMRRATAVTFMDLEFAARGDKDENGAAKAAAAAYPWFEAGQLSNWRKRANSGREPVLQAARDRLLAFWRGKYPGQPQEALAEMKKIAQEAKKVYWGGSK